MADIWVSYDEDEEAYYLVIDGLVVYLNTSELEELVDQCDLAMHENV